MAAIIAVVAGVATTEVVVGLVGSQILAALAGAVVSGVVGGALMSKPSTSDFNSSATNVMINKQANNAPIPVVYGTRRVGGTIVFMASHGAYQPFHSNHSEFDTKFLSTFLVISEGEIESYISFWANNEPTVLDKFESDLWIKERYGTETQDGFTELVNVLNIQNITYNGDTHRLAGAAYLWVEMFFNPEVYPKGVPTINALVKGVKVYDPRTLSTQWSDNPVLCVRDYLTNARYGRGIDPLLIDDASFILAANYCDEEVAYNGVDFVKRYTCNGVVETQNSSLDIIKKLLSPCRGLLIFSGGLYKVIIDKPELAFFTFSEDNIIGGWKIKLGGKNSQFNRMRANFVNARKEYQPDIAIVDSKELREQDSGLLEIMIDLPFNTDIVRAKAIIAINLKQSRFPISCEFTSTIEALRVEVGDVVYINHKTPGWNTHNSGSGKKFRIMRVTLQNNDEVRILANEYDDEVYDLDIQDFKDLPSIINIDDLNFCLPPTDLSYIITKTLLTVTWGASLDPFIVGYEVSYRHTNPITPYAQYDMGDSLSWSTPSSVSAFTTLESEVRVRAYNTIGVRSEWLE